MKMTKKIMSLAIVFAMVMAMSVSVFAAADGKITMTDATEGQTYTLYKVFDATYKAGANNVSYTYVAATEQDPFLAALQGENSPFTVNAITTTAALDYNVILKDNMAADDIVTFLNAQKANLGTGVEKVAPEGGTIEWTALDYGYYYITSTMGTVVTVDSALPEVNVVDKNTEPTISKEVQEDDGSTWGEKAVAQIGKDVNFRLTVLNASPAVDQVNGNGGIANNFVIVDDMPAGLTADASTVKVTIGGTEIKEGFEATVENANLKVVINAATLAAMDENNDTIVVTYSAKVNGAIDMDIDNTNTATLTYGTYTDSDTAKVTSYDFLLQKTDGANVITGAKFKLYDAATAGNEIKVVKVTEEDGFYYRVADANDTEFAVIEAGEVMIKGLDTDTYYLEEIEAPAGYNMLTARQPVTPDVEDVTATVVNNVGTELPSTGGIGTTIFYALGGLMAVGAGVLLIAKKRMEA